MMLIVHLISIYVWQALCNLSNYLAHIQCPVEYFGIDFVSTDIVSILSYLLFKCSIEIFKLAISYFDSYFKPTEKYLLLSVLIINPPAYCFATNL